MFVNVIAAFAGPSFRAVSLQKGEGKRGDRTPIEFAPERGEGGGDERDLLRGGIRPLAHEVMTLV